MGGTVAPDNNYNFSSAINGRIWIKHTYWKTIKSGIQVVDNFRYLGAHVAIGGKSTAATLKKRIREGIATLRKIAKLPVSRAHKAAIIRVKVFAAAFYCSEVSQIPERDLADFAVATANAVANHTRHHDIDWLFTTCSRGADLDIITNTIARKCTLLRRSAAKRPH